LCLASLDLNRNKWLIVSACSGLFVLGIVIYFITKHPTSAVYGEQFVKDEIALITFVQFKPITLIFMFGFLFFASLIQHLEREIASLSNDVRTFLFIVAFVVAAGSLYELFFNFTLWGALMSTTTVANPDILINKFPNPKTAVSMVYASKIVILIFAVSLYSMYFLNRLEKIGTCQTSKRAN